MNYKELIKNAILAWNEIATPEYELKFKGTITSLGTTEAPWYRVHIQVYSIHGALFYHIGEYPDATKAEETICIEIFKELMRAGINSQYKIIFDKLV
jgi:hypothetical protein